MAIAWNYRVLSECLYDTENYVYVLETKNDKT